jgi:hypothetical protein
LGLLIYLLFSVYPYLTLLISPASGNDISILSGAFTTLIWPVAYGILMISALHYRLRGIRL